MKKTRLLLDKTTGFLWLNKMNCYGIVDLIERPNLSTLDLATCEEILAEAVCAIHNGLCIASCDLLVYKNDKGLMTVMAPYLDSMGYGATYASILPGFPFKNAYCFTKNKENYIVAENESGKWGVIRISHKNASIWTKQVNVYSLPIEVVPFRCSTLDQAIIACGQTYTPFEMEMHGMESCPHYYNGNLALVPDDKNYFAGESDIDGDTIQDIMNRRR